MRRSRGSPFPPSPRRAGLGGAFRPCAHLVHGEVREEDDKVLLHPNDEARVTLETPRDHFHVVAHLEILAQLLSWELQHVLGGKEHR